MLINCYDIKSKMPDIYQEILPQIRNCNNWRQLYNLIQSDPERYNVHYCLVNCNTNLICGDFMIDLIINRLLNPEEVSHHYDHLVDPEIFEIGSRTWSDYLQYLAGTAQNDIESIRYAGAWNAPIDSRIYLQNQRRQDSRRPRR